MPVYNKTQTMKKLMTLCFFAFAMILGTQSVASQNIIEINSLASKKTQELKQVIKFSDETEELIYKTYQTYEQKKYDLEQLKARGESVAQEDVKRVENIIVEQFRSIFTEEEFARYLEFEKNQK